MAYVDTKICGFSATY